MLGSCGHWGALTAQAELDMLAGSESWRERGLRGPEGSGMVTEQRCGPGALNSVGWVPRSKGLGLEKRGYAFNASTSQFVSIILFYLKFNLPNHPLRSPCGAGGWQWVPDARGTRADSLHLAPPVLLQGGPHTCECVRGACMSVQYCEWLTDVRVACVSTRVSCVGKWVCVSPGRFA